MCGRNPSRSNRTRKSTQSYNGLYFVLLGALSPLDGIGPEELGLNQLLELITDDVKEVIIATNPTAEGQATAYYIARLLHKSHVKVSRIAQGVPVGGELEHIDQGTLIQAVGSRQRFES